MRGDSFAWVKRPGHTHEIEVFVSRTGAAKRSIHGIDENPLSPAFLVSPWNSSKDTYVWEDFLGVFPVEALPTFDFQCCFRSQLAHETSKISYQIQIENAIESIKKGLLQKVVVAREKWVPGVRSLADISEIFTQLCLKHPQAFVYVCSCPQWGTWMGASPEILIQHDGHMAEVMSLAGTLFHAEEQWSEKERSEQSVTSQFIESCLNWHATERVEIQELEQGELRHLLSIYRKKWPKYQLSELVERLSPTPAVCGHPREEALEFIEKNEGFARDLYAGFVGIQEAEALHLNVNLRCAEFMDNGIRLIAGGGINEQSQWEREWEETELKMRVIEANLF
jgi:isochorismate synthase